MASTRIGWYVKAPRATVYRLLLDPDAVAAWQVPTGMTSEVHEFDPREGGPFRISLTYDEPADTGKTTAQTDTFHGRFVRLVPDEQVVQIVEFETDDPSVTGEMTITIDLADSDGGTQINAVHDGLPEGVPLDQNELGWSISLGKLATLAETGELP
ncbi:SRPBCC family protein [Nocardia sp. NPDC049526]|uniref:SRPBCC family protein n=1 Tax=Nocardia sp. NPDC049526 TaxID=3364316 RepID=UPI0037BC35D3